MVRVISKITEQELSETLRNKIEAAANAEEYINSHLEGIMQEVSRLNKIADNSRKASDPLNAYPDGVTIMRVAHENLGFPFRHGVVITYKSGSFGMQMLANNATEDSPYSVITMRTWTPDTGKWTEWDGPETSGGSQYKVDQHAKRTDNPHKVTKAQVGLGNVDNVKQATKSEFDAHVNNKNNPHNVTKAQIGLANVDNVKQASKSEFDAHINDKNNPHNVTKAQIGLGNVDNVKQASKAEFDAHANDTNNPHGVTKAQVGLGSVQNYGIATQEEALAGTAHNKYMTPLRTKEAIEVHAKRTDNPHNVTKAQIGLGNVDNVKQASKAEFDAHANDSTKHITAEDRNRWDAKETPEGAQAKANQAEQNAKNYAIPKSMKGAANGVAELDSNRKIPLSQLPDLSATRTYVVETYEDRDELINEVRPGDRVIVLEAPDGSREGFLWDGEDWFKDFDTDWENISLEWANILNKPESDPADIDEAVSNAHTHHNQFVLDAIESPFTMEDREKLNSIEEGANYYEHPETHHADMIEESEEKMFVSQQEKNNWNSHINRVDNPHGVTKSQVGLSNVQNYGIATQAEAESGTANNKYMTPLRTQQAIQALVSPLEERIEELQATVDSLVLALLTKGEQ